MLARLSRVLIARRTLVLVLTVVFVAIAGALGGGVARRLSTGGFDDPSAPSSRGRAVLADRLHTGMPNLVLLVTAPGGNVDDPEIVAAGTTLTQELAAQAGVTEAASYWTLASPPPLRSTRGDQALVLARIGGSDDTVRDRIKTLSPAFTRTAGPLRVQVAGQAEVFRQVGTTIEHDLQVAEMVALPITLVLLVLVFGSLVAASLPLAIGVFSIFTTFLALRVVVAFTPVSVFALNLTTALGLGLAIDYSLFIMSRYREELAAGFEPPAAITRSVASAGRTVIFSASTVAISLAALLVFPQFFLRSFAYAGIAVAAGAAIGAVVVLPALLAVIGRRVDSLRILRRPVGGGGRFWHAVAERVMRRPLVIAASVTALVLLLGAPFLGIRFGTPDHRVLPSAATSRVAQEEISRNFASMESSPIEVVLTDTAAQSPAIGTYAATLSALPGVARVDASAGSFAGGRLVAPAGPAAARFGTATPTWLSVVPSVDPVSGKAEALVRQIRSTPAPGPSLVAGVTAAQVDTKHSIMSKAPIAGALIAIVTFAVLFLMLGSVVVPLKALVLNALSLSATFGAMVWTFQEGHFAGALGFTPTGTIDLSTPILMFCIAFGLSMDYEVFLLSRIKEEHDAGRDTVRSVSIGLERTGRIVTAAAVLISVVFIAFAASGITFIKLFGIGLALAVLMDAFLIRATLVPAFMRLAGEANWWAPRPMRRFYERFGFSEHVDLDSDELLGGPIATEVVGTMGR